LKIALSWKEHPLRNTYYRYIFGSLIEGDVIACINPWHVTEMTYVVYSSDNYPNTTDLVDSVKTAKKEADKLLRERGWYLL